MHWGCFQDRLLWWLDSRRFGGTTMVCFKSRLRRGQQLFPLPPGRFLGNARGFRDHALQLFHFAPQL